ncbi:AI-2E family transporter [Candidatus Villigracilis saccharophilus]|uniref:AI-2E family transporter n=1 Tax=Candidatus Villigracilis saccharophilus TaxID=3140684 RepID=UPI0031368699|nr:AI-2E family transporter [Anaerolineales bacterium]
MKNNEPAWSLPFRYVTGLILFVAIIALLLYARDAVKALIIAAFVAYLISPAVNFLMERTKLSRTAAVNIVYFSSLILLVGVPSTLTPIFFDEIKIVAQDLLDLSNEISAILIQPVRFGGMVFHFEQLGASLANVQNAVLTPIPEKALALLETTSVGVLWFLVIIVAVHLFMSEWPHIRVRLLEMSPSSYHDDLRELYRRVRGVWMAYLRGQIVLMIIVGIVFTIAWVIMGIPGALVLGVIAGLFTLVPDVGPFVAVILTMAVALLEGSSWIPLSNFLVAGIVFIVYLVLINLKNFWLRPYIMGRSVHMNEALIFIAIMIATILEGIMGALLVVPVLASVVVILEYLRRRVLGLPPFGDDGSQQFVAPPEKIKSRRAVPAVEQEMQEKNK